MPPRIAKFSKEDAKLSRNILTESQNKRRLLKLKLANASESGNSRRSSGVNSLNTSCASLESNSESSEAVEAWVSTGKGAPMDSSVSTEKGAPMDSSVSTGKGAPMDSSVSTGKGAPMDSSVSTGKGAPMDSSVSTGKGALTIRVKVPRNRVNGVGKAVIDTNVNSGMNAPISSKVAGSNLVGSGNRILNSSSNKDTLVSQAEKKGKKNIDEWPLVEKVPKESSSCFCCPCSKKLSSDEYHRI